LTPYGHVLAERRDGGGGGPSGCLCVRHWVSQKE
jgi:hypothetical protein